MADLKNQYDNAVDELGAIFRAAREAQSRDQESIERAVRLSRGTISRLENGMGSLPALETAIRIAQEVDADLEQVVGVMLRAQILRLLNKNDPSLLTKNQIAEAAIALSKSLGVSPAELTKMARRKS